MSEKTNNELNKGKFEASFDEKMQFFFKTPTENTKIVDLCRRKAEAGDHRAMLWLARMYRSGTGMRKDISKGIDYARQSAEGGEDGAINELVMLLVERGNDEDLLEAFNLASDFPKYNNAGLAVHLARMYRRGIGVNKDLNEAIRYMKIAAEKGHSVAKKELIDLLLERKKDYDIELAVTLSSELKDQGSDLYRKARVMMEPGSNIAKAIQRMSVAARDGDKNAKEDLFYLLQSKNGWQRPQRDISYYSKDHFKSSKYALLRGAYDPFKPLKSLGENSGNLAFWSAIEKLFHPDVLPMEYLRDKSSEYEKLIVTDLIWIREDADYSYLEKNLEDVKIPIVLMSVGLQSSENKTDFKLHESVIRILKNVQETSTIGVRGEYTESILNRYGIQNTQIIGCPSMYYWNDRNFKVGNKGHHINAIGNFRTFWGPLTNNEVGFIRFLKKWNCPFVEQTSMRLRPTQLGNNEDRYELCNYADQMSRIYYSNEEWIDDIEKYNFSIGSRFHGNVMGLRAGFKSLFLVTDSRTEEMASFFNLPSINIENFDDRKPMSHYYELADYYDFNRNYPKIFDEFNRFVQRNGMSMVNE